MLVMSGVLTAQLAVGPAVGADGHDLVPDESAAAGAARETAAAQDRANAAAEEWTLAARALEDLEAERAQLETEQQKLQANVDSMRHA